MKTIIALRGKASSGKTTTINILNGLLINNNYTVVKSNFNNNGGDFLAVYSKNGKYIGVTSSGDTYDLVHDNLQIPVNYNCDICVCACRTYDRIAPGTNAAIREFTNYENIYVEKGFEFNDGNQESKNLNDAKQLLNIINSML